MSEFFQSEVVRAELAEIQELQEEVYSNFFKFPSMSKDDQLYHIDILESLIEKQKIVYTRLSLSDDPEAKKMKEKLTIMLFRRSGKVVCQKAEKGDRPKERAASSK